jgi:hypothetical protein
MRFVPRWLPALAIAVGACGGDSGTGPSYENIAGSDAGVVSGVSQGVALQTQVGFTIAQTRGTLSGTWSTSGAVTDGFTTVAVSGTGTISGTIGAGNNPSVNITIFVPGCSVYRANFSGAYDVANRKITMTGPIDLLNDDCTVFRSYPTTLIITR